jgi:hypothetical protein
MTGTVLRLLQHRLRSKRLDDEADLFRLVTHNDNRLLGP